MRGPASALARCLTAGLLLAATDALAAPFDETSGTLSLEGSTLAWSLDALDELPSALGLEAKDRGGAQLGQAALAERFGGASAKAIEGRGALWLGDGLEQLVLGFADPARLQGRRVEISFWQQAHGVSATGVLAWFARGSRDYLVGMVRMLPTGRATDDGWIELSSGPIDFALGGALVPALVARVERSQGNAIGTDPQGRTLIDALEIRDLGPQAVASERCTLPTEAQACGSLGTCHFGRCVDSAAVYGQLPAEPLRGEYVDRRIFEVRHFNGNRVTDRTFEPFRAAMEEARAARSPKGFWQLITAAYELLGDGHGSPPTAATTERPALGMCLHLGEADRIPAAEGGASRLLPLVFHADGAAPAAAGLQPGDVLDTVDGLPVEQWKRLAGPRLQHYGSPLAREVSIAPALPALAMRTGGKLGFLRCPAAIAAGRRCLDSELERIEVDLYAQSGEPLWRGDVSGWQDEWLTCDFRFKRVGDTRPRGEYLYAATGDDGDVRILELNGVPHPSWAGEWVETIQGGLTPGPSRFLIDERTGYGGVFDTVDLIANPFFGPTGIPVAEVFPVIGRAMDEPTRQRFLQCASGFGLGLQLCGQYFSFVTGTVFPSGFGTLKDAKAALLISHDVSGNDYLTRFMKLRPALTRVFGPCPTFGAFGSIYGLSTYLSELSGGSAQLGDSLVYAGEGPAGFVWESGPGTMPDEVVFQTQSDLMAGRDTLVERAKAWLRE